MAITEQAPPFAARQVIHGRYLFSPKAGPHRPQELRVLCAGFEECSADYDVRRDSFPCAALELIVGGRWEMESAEGRWTLESGMLFTYGPDCRYALGARSSGGLRKYFVDIEGRDAMKALHRAGLRPGLPVRLAHARWLQDVIEQIIDTSRLKGAHGERLATMLLPLVFERLLADREVGGTRLSASRLAFERCRDHLAANYLQISDLDRAAQACGVSQVHLCRLFSKFASETPHAFVTQMRMNHAARLIARGDVSVKVAAMEVGYPDQGHFSRVFKRVLGCAPSRFCGGD
jgi:AraC-like DNA-binding protein